MVDESIVGDVERVSGIAGGISHHPTIVLCPVDDRPICDINALEIAAEGQLGRCGQ